MIYSKPYYIVPCGKLTYPRAIFRYSVVNFGFYYMHPNVKFFNFQIKILKNKNFELKIRKKDVVIGQ